MFYFIINETNKIFTLQILNDNTCVVINRGTINKHKRWNCDVSLAVGMIWDHVT